MEKSKVRKELDAFMEQQKELGAKRRDIALVLFARGYTEKNVGLVMSIDPRSAAAMKVDFSKKGKESIEKKGKRIHLDPAKANLKRVAEKKVITRFIELCDKVLAESDKTKGE